MSVSKEMADLLMKVETLRAEEAVAKHSRGIDEATPEQDDYTDVVFDDVVHGWRGNPPRPHTTYMKGAPSNFVKGKCYRVPERQLTRPYWRPVRADDIARWEFEAIRDKTTFFKAKYNNKIPRGL